MSVENSMKAAEIPDEEEGGAKEDQRGGDRFGPEAEEDLQERTVEKKDEEGGDDVEEDGEEEVKRDEAEEEEEVVVEDEEDKEDGDEDAEEEEEEEEKEEEDEEDSKEKSPSSISGDKSEFIDIDPAEIRKDVQCPICLGIIKKTRTVMECLHRFCRECIDKSMRLGNKECPACRKRCASRRSLRDDPTFDALIAALFSNIDTYEEEEFAFHEDDKARNKQIQASIAEVSQRQSEALVKRKSYGKETSVSMRPQRRRRRNSRNMEQNTVEEAHDDDNNDDNKDSSSEERGPEVRLRKRRKRSTGRATLNPSSSAANSNGNCAENDAEMNRDNNSKGISPGLVWNPEILAWGKGGTRSNTRHGNNATGGGSSSSKSIRNARVNRLVECLRSSVDGNGIELDMHLKLVSVDTKCVPELPQPYLCCRPTLLVKQLREFVALQIHLKTEEVELLVTRGLGGGGEDKVVENLPVVASDSAAAASKDEMQSLEDNETLSRLKVEQHLIIAYRQKKT